MLLLSQALCSVLVLPAKLGTVSSKAAVEVLAPCSKHRSWPALLLSLRGGGLGAEAAERTGAV